MMHDVAVTTQREVWALDLLEHPGWKELLHDIETEARSARRAIFHGEGDTAESQGLAVARARGSLAVLSNIVGAIYRRANLPMPAPIEALFQ